MARSDGDDGDQRRDDVGAAAAASDLAERPATHAGMVVTEDAKTADQLDAILGGGSKKKR